MKHNVRNTHHRGFCCNRRVSILFSQVSPATHIPFYSPLEPVPVWIPLDYCRLLVIHNKTVTTQSQPSYMCSRRRWKASCHGDAGDKNSRGHYFCRSDGAPWLFSTALPKLLLLLINNSFLWVARAVSRVHHPPRPPFIHAFDFYLRVGFSTPPRKLAELLSIFWCIEDNNTDHPRTTLF